MNGLKPLIAPLAVAGILATVAFLWHINAQIAVMDERLNRVLAHSDKNDEAFDLRLRILEQRLNELKR